MYMIPAVVPNIMISARITSPLCYSVAYMATWKTYSPNATAISGGSIFFAMERPAPPTPRMINAMTPITIAMMANKLFSIDYFIYYVALVSLSACALADNTESDTEVNSAAIS